MFLRRRFPYRPRLDSFEILKNLIYTRGAWWVASDSCTKALRTQAYAEFSEIDCGPAYNGEVAEWFKAAVLKTAIPERVS